MIRPARRGAWGWSTSWCAIATCCAGKRARRCCRSASRRRRGLTKRVMALGPLRDYVAKKMRDEASKKARKEHYPAPYALIDLFEKHGDDWRAMMRGEIDGLRAADGDRERRRNLRRVFFLSEGLKKQGLRGAEKPEFARVHVIGAGVMGGDIAAWCALRGMAVTLQDLDMERIKPALDRAKSLFKKRLKGSTRSPRRWRGSRPIPTGKGIARADVIIEAVVEKLEIKQKIFARRGDEGASRARSLRPIRPRSSSSGSRRG